MRSLVLLVLALGASGCTLVFGPDRDFSRDGGMDAGPGPIDGGQDSGEGLPDGGDAGPPSCVPSQPLETDCTNDVDEDCNGLVDCADFACAASPDCCEDGMGQGMPFNLPPFQDWWHDGLSGLPAHPSANIVDFGTASFPQAIVYQDFCAPLAFGLDLSLTFDVTMGSSGHYAALKLSPIDDREGGTAPFLAELTVRVRDDGTATLERAGAIVMTVPVGTDPLVRVQLRPGVDSANRGVVLVSVEADGRMLADQMPFMPFSDLRGAPTCTPDGLFLVLEGQGTNVRVVSDVGAEQFACENPSQFLADTTLADNLVPEFEDDASGWRTGGMGEPAVLHVDRSGSERIELWADAARIERSDELLRFIDFTIGATRRQGAGWSPRLLDPGGVPELLGPSAREPSLGVPFREDGLLPPGRLILVAYARENSGVYDLQLAQADTDLLVNFSSQQELLRPDEVGCRSLRDPSIVVLDPDATQLLVFYTCEQSGMADRIGVARFGFVDPLYTLEVHSNDLLTSSIGSYAARGVFSPEAVLIPDDDEPSSPGIRLWFLSRDNAGRVAMSTAFGEIPTDKVLPVVSPYPGNPTLRADNPLLFETPGSCDIGCTLEAVGVARTIPGGSWSDPSYLIVVAHSRQTVTGVDHALVPVLQPRPAGE